jgi:hypothetical protein
MTGRQWPYINSLSFGRPAYSLLNDSNVDWNQALPEVKRFAEQQKIDHLKIDEYGVTEVTDFVPNSELWDCQSATAADAGSWVVVSAGCILDAHNCAWLQQFPMQAIAGGSMYALHLPSQIPPWADRRTPPTIATSEAWNMIRAYISWVSFVIPRSFLKFSRKCRPAFRRPGTRRNTMLRHPKIQGKVGA